MNAKPATERMPRTSAVRTIHPKHEREHASMRVYQLAIPLAMRCQGRRGYRPMLPLQHPCTHTVSQSHQCSNKSMAASPSEGGVLQIFHREVTRKAKHARARKRHKHCRAQRKKGVENSVMLSYGRHQCSIEGWPHNPASLTHIRILER